jgi:hypothetical protein
MRFAGDGSLDDALEGIGVTTSSSLLRIDVEDGGVEFEFGGWVSIRNGDGDVSLTLVRDFD